MKAINRWLIVVGVLTLANSAHARKPGVDGWFFSITPPNGGQTFDVGPYNSLYGCRDWLGSALYLHPTTCHNHPNDYNCRIIGNGYAYPQGFPYPVPADEQIPSGDCFESNQPGLGQGNYYFFYSNIGGSVVGGARSNRKCNKSRRNTLGETGSGCFFVGDTGE